MALPGWGITPFSTVREMALSVNHKERQEEIQGSLALGIVEFYIFGTWKPVSYTTT
jgi:hypothetical protein